MKLRHSAENTIVQLPSVLLAVALLAGVEGKEEPRKRLLRRIFLYLGIFFSLGMILCLVAQPAGNKKS